LIFKMAAIANQNGRHMVQHVLLPVNIHFHWNLFIFEFLTVLYKLCVFYVDRNSKMTTTAGHSFYIGPIGFFDNQVNDTGFWEQLHMAYYIPTRFHKVWSRHLREIEWTKMCGRIRIIRIRWLPPQVIVLTQDHMEKIQKYNLLWSYCTDWT
jgi:Ulp1 family protease